MEMLPQYEIFKGDSALSGLKDDEILVGLCSLDSHNAKFWQSLKEKAVPSLSSSHEYMQLHFGFAQDYRKPFFLVEWQKAGNHALERRWLFKEIKERIKKQFNLKKVAVLLDDEASPGEVAMAEDLYFSNLRPLDDGNYFDSFKIYVQKNNPLVQSDKFRDIRLKHYFEYRHWINENPDELTSIEIGRRLQSFARKHGCEFQEFDVAKLKEMKMNLLLAVGQASQRSPSRLFVVTHNPGKSTQKPLMLVGKGITFDTGGINLKAFENFVNAMKNDMGGAALVSHLFMALVESGYDKPLVLVVPSCENLIAQEAVKPGAVVTSYSGKKVVIEHTDAEGRLILADALSYAQEKFSPALTIIAATLTTAALRQFTNYFTPVHFAGHDFKEGLQQAGDLWGERFSFWDEFLPFAFGNKSAAADLTNMGRMPGDATIGGGSNVAAHFLKSFATFPIVHIDIFATCWNWSKEYPGAGFGATGAPFNSLFHFLR